LTDSNFINLHREFRETPHLQNIAANNTLGKTFFV